MKASRDTVARSGSMPRCVLPLMAFGTLLAAAASVGAQCFDDNPLFNACDFCEDPPPFPCSLTVVTTLAEEVVIVQTVATGGRKRSSPYWPSCFIEWFELDPITDLCEVPVTCEYEFASQRSDGAICFQGPPA